MVRSLLLPTTMPHTPAAPTAPDTAFWLGDTDVWLLAEGKHLRPCQKLGAHPTVMQGASGTAFAVWAPQAQHVGLMGDFNHWQPQPMRPECGVWEVFVPGASVGAWYKFEVLGADGHTVHKTDPYARETELPPGNAARVAPALKAQPERPTAPHTRPPAPMAIYEVHVGSWRRPGGPTDRKSNRVNTSLAQGLASQACTLGSAWVLVPGQSPGICRHDPFGALRTQPCPAALAKPLLPLPTNSCADRPQCPPLQVMIHSHLPATEGAQQRKHLADACDERCPQVMHRAFGLCRLHGLGAVAAPARQCDQSAPVA